jgi:hypothetical protein
MTSGNEVRGDLGDEETFTEVQTCLTFNELAEVVQLLVMNDKPWTIHVSSGTGMSGVVGTTPGKVCYARTGEVRGPEAFCQMISWSKGHIARQTTAVQPDEMDIELPKLLMEAYWYSIEKASADDGFDHALELGAELSQVEETFEVSPELRARFEQIAALDGFASLALRVNTIPCLVLGDEPSAQETTFYEEVEQTWDMLGGEGADAIALLGGKVHMILRIAGEAGVDIHVVLDQRDTAYAMTVFQVRSILSRRRS